MFTRIYQSYSPVQYGDQCEYSFLLPTYSVLCKIKLSLKVLLEHSVFVRILTIKIIF